MTDQLRRFGDLLISMGLVTDGQVQEALALQPLTGARVGEALLSLGYLTRGQLQRALAAAVQQGDAIVLDRPPLGEILLGLRYVTSADVEAALATQQRTGQRLGEVLVEAGRLTHQQLYEALGLQQRMTPQLDLGLSAAPALPNGQRLVVIDDSELACAFVEEALSAQGYTVASFTDPFLALESLDGFKPDLVLTDLEMPGLDGQEICRRLKSGPRAVPVIILTANDGDEVRVRGLREGADDYVNKGASMEELAARVENVLRRTRETDRVRRLFARYTSDAVVDEILKQGDVVLTGEKRVVTVLFADLRHFTAFAETRAPEEVMRRLNDVLGRMADVVLEHQGTLDKFLGDGLMAVWGAPVSRPDDVRLALSAALELREVCARTQAVFPEGERFEVGVGLNTGPVLAGSLGSTRRTEYTCIGDAVNVASRLCALAAPGEVLVGEGTVQALGPDGFEPLEPVRVKGKAQPVSLSRVTPALAADVAARRRF